MHQKGSFFLFHSEVHNIFYREHNLVENFFFQQINTDVQDDDCNVKFSKNFQNIFKEVALTQYLCKPFLYKNLLSL